MSWKSGPDRFAAALRAPWPIALKLALLFFASSALILLAVSAVLYDALEDKLQVRDQAAVVDYALAVQQVLLESAPAGGVEQPDWLHKAEERVLGGLRFQMRILDADGQTVLEAPDMSADERDFPAPAELPGSDMATAKLTADTGNAYLLASAWVTQGGPRSPRYRLQLALDLTDSEAVLDSYKRELLLVLAIALLAAAAAAGAVGYASLRPLRAFTRAAQAVRPDSLSVRLGEGRWPRELSGLALAFDQMLDRLEEAFVRLARYSADLAHEFRTPVQNLVAATSVALSRTRSIEEYQTLLDASLREYQRLGRMVDQMLFIARSENAQTQLQRESLSCREEFDALLDFFGIAAEEASVTLQAQGAARVWADRSMFRQAVSNLLSNALRHTPAGGNVSVAAHNNAHGDAMIVVTDSGPGIAAEHQPRVFDRFYRVDHGRSRQSAGAGLGLAIVQSIMRLHGGEARVVSEQGCGASFYLRFPSEKATKAKMT